MLALICFHWYITHQSSFVLSVADYIDKNAAEGIMQNFEMLGELCDINDVSPQPSTVFSLIIWAINTHAGVSSRV